MDDPAKEQMLPAVKLLGTERSISKIGLGGMNLSIPPSPDWEDAKRVIQTAVEGGVTLIDTADTYAADQSEIGHNERLIAEALGDMGIRVDDGPVVVATKGGRTRFNGRWGLDGRPAHLRDACEASLRALGTERISLYQLHAPDSQVPYADSVGALADLRQEGKIEAVGISNVSIEQLDIASSIVPVSSVQNSLSVWDIGYRPPPILKRCQNAGIVFLAYSPLGGRGVAHSLTDARLLAQIASEIGLTPQELALAWLMHLAHVLVPIPGATTQQSVESFLKCSAVGMDKPTSRLTRKALHSLPGHQGLISRVFSRLRRLRGRTDT